MRTFPNNAAPGSVGERTPYPTAVPDTGSTTEGRWRVRHFALIDSTNRYLLDEARAGAESGLVAVADHQTAGRGRFDRRWEAPPGSSLLVSVLLRPVPVDAGHRAMTATALALADAVEAVAGFAPELKWPNDLVVGDRKLAGLLAESVDDARGDRRRVQRRVVVVPARARRHRDRVQPRRRAFRRP